ncbi:ribbon-helix-helix domain-containing protein [Ursidibacter arcticus]
MALSRVQINAKSEAKRGIKVKSFKLHESTIAHIEQISQQTGISQSRLITQAIEMLGKHYQVTAKSVTPLP